jgi:hypothetical protein
MALVVVEGPVVLRQHPWRARWNTVSWLAISASSGMTCAPLALFALTRGLTEQTAEPRPHVHRDTLATAKRLIRGTLFSSSHATGG